MAGNHCNYYSFGVLLMAVFKQIGVKIMKDFLYIYEMLLDELANYKISEVAALGQKFQLEITETSIRSELHQLLSPIIDPLLVNI